MASKVLSGKLVIKSMFLVFVCYSAQVVAQATEVKKMDDTVLVIVASVGFDGGVANEFIVLRRSGESLKWTASAFNKQESISGTTHVANSNLGEMFRRVATLSVRDVRAVDKSATSYSLLLIDENNSQAHCQLNDVQRAELGNASMLGPVFKEIVAKRVYGRVNPMLPLVVPGYRATATTTVEATERIQQLSPQTHAPSSGDSPR